MQVPAIVVFVVLLAVATTTSMTWDDTPEPMKPPAFDETTIVSDNSANPRSQSTEGETRATIQSTEEERCQRLIGECNRDGFNGLPVTYDPFKILEEHGGLPGKVNATWNPEKSGPVGPYYTGDLPTNDNKNKEYRFRDTDGKTYLRIEQGARRFTEIGNENLGIVGTIYWSPPDFCGKLRKATYSVIRGSYSFDVSQEYCWIVSPTSVRCAQPPTLYVHDGTEGERPYGPCAGGFGGGGPSSGGGFGGGSTGGLLASLVGR